MRKKIAGMLTLVLVMIAMIGCSMKNTAIGSNTEREKASVTPSSAEGEKLSETPTPSEAAAELDEDRFSLYLSLLMKHQDEINPILGEEPEKKQRMRPLIIKRQISGYGLSGEMLIRYGRLIRPLILMAPT